MNTREFRQEMHLTLEEAATEIGIPYSTLSRVETERNAPDAWTLMKIQTWAEKRRRRLRLSARYRIDWAWIEGKRHRKRGGGRPGR